MRTLSPVKAISHALRSVVSYPSVALRIGMFWIPLLFALGLVGQWIGAPDPQATQPGLPHLFQLVSAVVGIIAVSSMAVSWHRFILRDELGSPSRLDGHVWRYAGNFLLIMLMVAVPLAVILVALAYLPQAAAVIMIPAGLLAGATLYRLSIKLPAVALGNAASTFRDIWRATEGSFWPLLGVFLLNTVLLLATILLLLAVISGLNMISPVLGEVIGLILSAAIQLFYTLFNASVFTSLYGFFVERRDF